MVDHSQRFDYAWKWFEFHAKQRTTMFNFFLVFTGIIASGIFSLLKEPSSNHLAAAAASVFGCFVSLGFIVLEFRNRALVDCAEDVLLHLEQSEIFSWNEKKGTAPLALLYREKKSGVAMAYCQHKYWIPIIQGFFCLGFIALTIYSVR
jgi:hypothetical protein